MGICKGCAHFIDKKWCERWEMHIESLAQKGFGCGTQFKSKKKQKVGKKEKCGNN